MKLCHLLFVSAALFAGQAYAAKPTEASIKEIFALANTEQLIKNVEDQIDGMTKNMMKQTLKDHPPTPEEQQAFERFHEKSMRIYKAQMSWDRLEPKFIEIYASSLTQEEVDGMIAFYKSPAGQAYIKKMPVLMQNSMHLVQEMMGPMSQDLQKAVKEFQDDLKNIHQTKSDKK